MQIKTNDHVFVCGMTQSGKSTFVKKRLWYMYPRRIFHDIQLKNDDLLDHAVLATTPQMLKDQLTVGHHSILYQPKSSDGEDFNQVCKVIYQHGNYALFVDEATAVCEPGWIEPHHKELMLRGMSRGIGVINLAQRPSDCHKNTMSEARHLIIFHLNLPHDVEKVRKFLPKEHWETPYSLPDFHCIYVNRGNVTLLKPI